MDLNPSPARSSGPAVCRVLPHRIADGGTQMAWDEALLDSVAEGHSLMAVRTYEWSTPTLSLGYFQNYEEVDRNPRWQGLPVVRRMTGGGALWHDREITYAVVVARAHPLAHPSSALYRAVHEAIADHLHRLGWRASRREAASASWPTSAEPAPRPFLCFQDHDRQDVVIGGVKVVGSAQRRRLGAVLQHGSILLSRAAATPELPGLADLPSESPGVPAVDPAELTQLLGTTLGGVLEPSGWTVAEEQWADQLRRDRYNNPTWTRRR